MNSSDVLRNSQYLANEVFSIIAKKRDVKGQREEWGKMNIQCFFLSPEREGPICEIERCASNYAASRGKLGESETSPRS